MKLKKEFGYIGKNYIENDGVLITEYGFIDTTESYINRILKENGVHNYKYSKDRFKTADGFIVVFIRVNNKYRDKMKEVFERLDRALSILYGKKYEENRVIFDQVREHFDSMRTQNTQLGGTNG